MSSSSVSAKLTVAYDGQFWIAFFERESGGVLSVARHVFGPEPSMAQILELVSGRAYQRIRYLPASTTATPAPQLAANPKRRQRDAAKDSRAVRVSTRSQDAFKGALESLKADAAADRRTRRDAAADEIRAKRIAKRKEKKRGH